MLSKLFGDCKSNFGGKLTVSFYQEAEFIQQLQQLRPEARLADKIHKISMVKEGEHGNRMSINTYIVINCQLRLPTPHWNNAFRNWVIFTAGDQLTGLISISENTYRSLV
jgi:hypothetical protein